MATIRSEQPAITALPAKQRPATTAIRGTSPESAPRARRRRVSSAETTGIVGVAGAAAATLGEEARSAAASARSARRAGPSCGARARPGCRPAPCSRRRAPRRRRRSPKRSPLTGAVPPMKPSAGVRGDQVVEVAAAALGGDREAPVLDEAARVDQVGEVLARGAAARRVAPRDRLGAGRVLGQRPPRQQLGEVGALLVAALPRARAAVGHVSPLRAGRPASSSLCRGRGP